MHHPTDWMTHTTAFVTPVVEQWLEREIDLNRKADQLFLATHSTFIFTVICRQIYGKGLLRSREAKPAAAISLAMFSVSKGYRTDNR